MVEFFPGSRAATLEASRTSQKLAKAVNSGQSLAVAMQHPPENAPLPAGVPAEEKTIVARMPNITVPQNRTNYLCTHFEVPLGRKHHVLSYQGLPASKLIHHMVIFRCSRLPPAFGDVYQCPNRMDPGCQEFLMLWAPGAGVREAPEQAALPLGDNGTEYLALQVGEAFAC